MAKVFLVDDDAAVRHSLSLLLESEGLEVAAYASAEDFLAEVDSEAAGCAILDLKMAGMDGIRLQEEMVKRGIHLPIIFLTGHGDIPTTVRAIKAGAVNFLSKPVGGKELLMSVAGALELAAREHEHYEQNTSAAARLASLTDRENAVMRLLIEGLSNKLIARHLDISHRTVEIHKANVLRKTRAGNLLELIRLARLAGICE